MSETASGTRITQVGTVFVAVADQDRALDFYREKLGFEKRVDVVYGEGHRWVEVAPPGSAIALALVPPSEGQRTPDDAARCAFASEDVEADRATLQARGVDVDPQVARTGRQREGIVSPTVSVRDPVPPQCFFRDLDGNRFLLVQPG